MLIVKRTVLHRMLTDNVISLPSSWYLDNILVKDVPPQSWKQSPERVNDDPDFYVIEESNIDRIRQFHDYCSVGYQSTGNSIASSECSDDLYLDLEDDSGIELFGDLASSVLNIIQDMTETETYSLLDNDTKILEDVSIPESCDDCTQNDCTKRETDRQQTPSSIDLSCSNCSNYSSKHKHNRRGKNKKWNNLNEDEKAAIVDELSQRISQDLGIREQLEVIKIIDPKSRVLPTDRQFLIDVMKMTEEKMLKIQDYIKTHTCRDCQSDDSSISKSPKKSRKKFQSQERKQRHRIEKQRQKREYKQILKERRSGLFVREEVMSMSRLSPPPEEEDIDILG